MDVVKKEAFFVDYDDLAKEVKKRYGIEDYHFVEIQECGNDVDFVFEVKSKLTGDYDKKYTAAEIEKMKQTKHVEGYQNHNVLTALCMDGFIEPGTYVVRVSW